MLISHVAMGFSQYIFYLLWQCVALFNYFYYKKVILKNYQKLNNSDLNVFSLTNYLLQNAEQQYARQYLWW